MIRGYNPRAWCSLRRSARSAPTHRHAADQVLRHQRIPCRSRLGGPATAWVPSPPDATLRPHEQILHVLSVLLSLPVHRVLRRNPLPGGLAHRTRMMESRFDSKGNTCTCKCGICRRRLAAPHLQPSFKAPEEMRGSGQSAPPTRAYIRGWLGLQPVPIRQLPSGA